MFDSKTYVQTILASNNCTQIRSDVCLALEHDAQRDASDQAFRLCFYYCNQGMLGGLCWAVVTLGVGYALWHGATLKTKWITCKTWGCNHWQNWVDKISNPFITILPNPKPQLYQPQDSSSNRSSFSPPDGSEDSRRRPLSPPPLSLGSSLDLDESKNSKYFPPPPWIQLTQPLLLTCPLSPEEIEDDKPTERLV